MQTPCEGFQNALSRFRESLTEKQRRDFHVCSLQDVTSAIRHIEGHLSSQRRQRNMNRIAKFLEAMTQLGKVVEVFLNVESTVAFVWAPIKFILLAAGTWIETLDRLLDTYAEIGEILPSLTQYERLLKRYPPIQVHLENYYCDILDFHRKALDVFSRPSWKTLFHSSWRTFTARFGETLSKLKRHRDLLSDEKITAAIFEVQDLRESMEDKFQELARKIQELHLDNDEDKTLQQRKRLDEQREFVFSKLTAPNYQVDFERASQERRNTPSGDWILNDKTYTEWVDTTEMGHRKLYLNGIPGTGKTILASRVIEHVKEVQVQNKERGLNSTVAYFFFKHSQFEKRNMTAMVLAFLYQLANQDQVVLELLYQEFLAVDPQKACSTLFLQQLATKALESQRLCFLIVDGLDECSEDLSSNRNESQGQIIEWLEAMMTPRNDVAPESDSGDRCIRLLLCGQRNGFLDKRLCQYSQIQLETILEHKKDISAYTEAKVQLLRDKFEITEEMKQKIMVKVYSAAKGMFLYAKVVLGNLLSQRSLGHVKRELKMEHFPKGLDEAYERVVVHVLENPNTGERDAAQKILGYVMCAERPMMWKELQSRFCIDIRSETADPDFRLPRSTSAKTLCGSLVEVEKDDNSIVSSDNVIDLVHETARTYLQQSRRVDVAIENRDMAMFCTQYLRSKPFSRDLDKSGIQKFVLSGYYGFLDYASANWWRHAKRITNYPHEIQSLAALQDVSELLESLQDYSMATKRDMPTMNIEALRQRIIDLPDESRDVDNTFSFESSIRRVRASIEDMSDSGPETLGDAKELYGYLSYKCPKPWCAFFTKGLETKMKRDNHVSEHERPFRCAVGGCLGQEIGFATQSELNVHNIRLHDQPTKVKFPSFRPQKAENLIKSMFRAVTEGHLADVQEYVAAGVDVNAINPRNHNDFPLFVAASSGHTDICRYLLEEGADIDAQCKRTGATALDTAVTNARNEITSLLLDAGADTRVKNGSGATIMSRLHLAIQKEHINTIRLLLASDRVDVNQLDCEGSSPFHQAIRTKQIDTIRLLLTSDRVDVNKLDRAGYSPFHRAIYTKDIIIIQLLLTSNRIDVNQLDRAGYSPFHRAIYTKYITIIKLFLTSTRIHVHQLDRHGSTPLCLAITQGVAPELADLIYTAEASLISTTGSNAFTSLHAATCNLNSGIVEYILSGGGVEINERHDISVSSRKSLLDSNAFWERKTIYEVLCLAMTWEERPDRCDDLWQARRIMEAVLSSAKASPLEMPNDDEQTTLRKLAYRFDDGERLADMVNAGFFYFPWEAATWLPDGVVSISEQGDNPEFPTLLRHHVILEVVYNSKCRFLDVAKANFVLARDILQSGKVTPDLLNLGGLDELLTLFHARGSIEVLQAVVSPSRAPPFFDPVKE